MFIAYHVQVLKCTEHPCIQRASAFFGVIMCCSAWAFTAYCCPLQLAIHLWCKLLNPPVGNCSLSHLTSRESLFHLLSSSSQLHLLTFAWRLFKFYQILRKISQQESKWYLQTAQRSLLHALWALWGHVLRMSFLPCRLLSPFVLKQLFCQFELGIMLA